MLHLTAITVVAMFDDDNDSLTIMTMTMGDIIKAFLIIQHDDEATMNDEASRWALIMGG